MEEDDLELSGWDQATKDRFQDVKKLINQFFPGIQTANITRGNTDKENDIIVGNSIDFILPNENARFSKSSYFHTEKHLTHFTSLENAIKIIESKTLRFYNLRNLNDPREFTFAGRYSKDSPQLFEDAKDNMFIMSFCRKNILNKLKSKDEFNMWRLYGNNGKGAAMVFSIVNDPMEWEDFHCSKINYGASKRTVIKRFYEALDDLNKVPPYIAIDWGKLHIFHKSRLYLPEMEVRVVFDNRTKRNFHGWSFSQEDIQTFPIIKDDVDRSEIVNHTVRYLELPIYTENFTPIVDCMPVFKIEEIHLGYNYLADAEEKLAELKQVCLDNIGYSPIVRQTSLKKVYWEPF